MFLMSDLGHMRLATIAGVTTLLSRPSKLDIDTLTARGIMVYILLHMPICAPTMFG